MGIDIIIIVYNMVLYYIISLVDCGPPMSPINGHLGYYSNTKEESNLTFQCNENFVPSIVRIATCDRFGKWYPSPMEHECTKIEGN